MKRFVRYLTGIFFFLTCIGVVCVAVIIATLTDYALIRLNIPHMSELNVYTENSSIEIFASNGTPIFKKNYTYGGKINAESDIENAIYLINALQHEKNQNEKPLPKWQQAMLKAYKLNPETLQTLATQYYTDKLTDKSRLKGFRKKLLTYFTMQRIQETYSEHMLYVMLLNSLQYSPQVQGIIGGAKAYFNKTYDTLTELELSFLIAKAMTEPDQDNQYYDKVARRFIGQLHEVGRVTNSKYQQLLTARLNFARPPASQKEIYIVNRVFAELEKFPNVRAGEKDLKIYTHYNIKATQAAERALAPLFDSDGRAQAAFVMANVATGGIEVAIGSRNNSNSVNRAFTNHRQMGSTFKPIVYATAFNSGVMPSERIVDRPYKFGAGKNAYTPRNYKNVFKGTIPIRSGLVHSLNNATVKLAEKTGLSNVHTMAKELGFKAAIYPYYAMALGAFSTTPVNAAEIYTTIANFGQTKQLSVLRTVFSNGVKVEPPNIEHKQVITPVAAYQTMYIMQDVPIIGTARGTGMLSGTAAKTGTTDHSKDLWTIAICYPYIIVVWVGYDGNGHMDETLSGGNTVAPIVSRFQKYYFGSDRSFQIPVPEHVVFKRVRTSTGLLARPNRDGNSYLEAFSDEILPDMEQ